MKAKFLTLLLVSGFAWNASAQDVRDEAVLNSKMVKSILAGLQDEQGLSCRIAIEEDGGVSIAYFEEDNLSKFSAGFVCTGGDGRSAVIKGVIGDGGQTQTESFSLVYAK